MGGLHDFSVIPRPFGSLNFLGLGRGFAEGASGLRVWGQGLTINQYNFRATVTINCTSSINLGKGERMGTRFNIGRK